MIPVGVQPNNIVVKSFVLAQAGAVNVKKRPRIYADLHGFKSLVILSGVFPFALRMESGVEGPL